MGALQQRQQKLCAISKQTPIPCPLAPGIFEKLLEFYEITNSV
jgi:hypothetical protein